MILFSFHFLFISDRGDGHQLAEASLLSMFNKERDYELVLAKGGVFSLERAGTGS